MSNINFFRVLQSGGVGGEDEPFNIDFSCNNSTTVNLTDFSSTYSSSANFGVFAVNTSNSNNSGSYLYASKYSGLDDPDQMIQQFEYNRDTNDNGAFPKIDDMTDNVKGEGTKIFRIDQGDTITGGFTSGGSTIFGFKQDIIVTGNNSQTNPSTTLVVDAYRFVGGINYTKIYQFPMTSSWMIDSINTGSVNHITVVNDYDSNNAPVPSNAGMCFNHDGSKLFHYQTGRRVSTSPIQINRWLTIIPLTTDYDLSTWQSSTTQSINLNSELGFEGATFNTSMQVFFKYDAYPSTSLRDIIRIYSSSGGGLDNEIYFEIDSNNDIANVSSSYNSSTLGATYIATSNAYTFKSTASADGSTDGWLYDNELAFTGPDATSLTQCEWTSFKTFIA